MPTFIKLPISQIVTLIVAANTLLVVYISAGEWKPTSEWSWADIVGEGGAGLLILFWLFLIVKSRPAGRITTLLTLGLGLMFLAWWADTLDELIRLPEAVEWDHWVESAPMTIGLLLLTYGLYHWHHEQLAISRQRQKQERLFREHRYFDPVTPLSGAQYLREHIDQCINSDQQPNTLIALDINHFDRVNQEYGHREGDRVLQAVSQLLLLNVRNQDLLCRLAGDRFVLLLPNTGEAAAREIARELELAIEYFALRTTLGERISLSLTTAVIKATGDNSEQLLERLQLALNCAKSPMALRA